MPNTRKPKAAVRQRESATLDTLSEWVQQGTDSFFATQRILLDLVMRQNANTLTAVRDRLGTVRTAPTTALIEMTGEGVSNFIAAQRIVLQLAQRQNEIVVGAVRERVRGPAPLTAMTDLLRRGV